MTFLSTRLPQLLIALAWWSVYGPRKFRKFEDPGETCYTGTGLDKYPSLFEVYGRHLEPESHIRNLGPYYCKLFRSLQYRAHGLRQADMVHAG